MAAAEAEEVVQIAAIGQRLAVQGEQGEIGGGYGQGRQTALLQGGVQQCGFQGGTRAEGVAGAGFEQHGRSMRPDLAAHLHFYFIAQAAAAMGFHAAQIRRGYSGAAQAFGKQAVQRFDGGGGEVEVVGLRGETVQAAGVIAVRLGRECQRSHAFAQHQPASIKKRQPARLSVEQVHGIEMLEGEPIKAFKASHDGTFGQAVFDAVAASSRAWAAAVQEVAKLNTLGLRKRVFR